MFRPFFERDDRWENCLEEMESWMGTPYRHLKMTKGRGADCTLFLASIWKYCGVLTEVKYDYYSRDWYVHTNENLVMDSLVYHMRHCTAPGIAIVAQGRKDRDIFYRGDMIGFSFRENGIVNHAALWVGDYPKTKQTGQFINCIDGAGGHGVCRMTYGSLWVPKTQIVLRVMEKV
jgi:cell wall-associated NlpC family hydrolase